jgi:hypothetical protein
MLAELWERLRGYDRWTQTEAIVHSSDPKLDEVQLMRVRGEEAYASRLIGGSALGSLVKGFEDLGDKRPPAADWVSICWFSWMDESGKPHRSQIYRVIENSPLFQLIDGETVTLRYNPANPDQFFFRVLFQSQIQLPKPIVRLLVLIGIVGILILFYSIGLGRLM